MPSVDSSLSAQANQSEGFWYQWGPLAWLDLLIFKNLVVKKSAHLVEVTYLAVIKLSAPDPERVQKDYEEILGRAEPIRFTDSPREKWRKYYGNFVREMEWALLELSKYFPREDYQEFVLSTASASGEKELRKFFDLVEKISGDDDPNKVKEKGPISAFFSKLMAKLINPSWFASFLVGESEVVDMNVDMEAGEPVLMEVKDCAYHTCASLDSLPNPGSLPQEGCLLICKGAFERIFNGKSNLHMEFDPHLPETSCTIRISVKQV